MKKTISLFVTLFFMTILQAQDKMPYQIFDKKGKKTNYSKMLKEAGKTDIVLFGEHHDNSVVHWLQLELTKDLAEKRDVVLGAEMIEADNQKQLDQYLKGEIDQKAFDTLARLWNNHKTDYKPLVDFAKEHQKAFIATNVPRRYASMVFKNGFEVLETLKPEERNWIAPLPIAYDPQLPGYVKMIEMMGGHGGDNLPKAQAIKDATMAYFIRINQKEDAVFIHYNGTYHSDNFEGIYWYLMKSDPKSKIITIATVTQKNISQLEAEHYNKADYILVVDEDVTRTY